MRTHPESVWLRTVDIDHARESEWTNDAVVTHSETWVRSDEIEYVPAKAYTDLKSAARELVELCKHVTMRIDIGRRSIIEASEKLKGLL